MTRKKTKPEATKLFVLDTNILMHDPACIFKFKEHDVYIPTVVLEELDDHKKGTSDLARNVRQAMRSMTELFETVQKDAVADGIPISGNEHRSVSGRLYFQSEEETAKLEKGISRQKADNQILAVIDHLRTSRSGKNVILVSKDLNIRIKASAKGIPSEDYENDSVLEDSDIIYSGVRTLTTKECERLMKGVHVSKEGRKTRYKVRGALAKSFIENESIIIDGESVDENLLTVRRDGHGDVVLSSVADYYSQRENVYGVCARNLEQNIALNLLMDPDIDLVTMLGPAGTGKTLLALAAGLHHIFEAATHRGIIVTRATIPLGEDIGFLPGNEEEKMGPWMGAINDNLEFLSSEASTKEGGKRSKVSRDDVMERIAIRSLSFMRGRTIPHRILIVDEAQNLTSKQMKAFITRAGNGTKVVCLGNLAQIDNPYVTERTSGLTYAVERLKGWPHYGHVTLTKVERSRLAEYATKVMQG